MTVEELEIIVTAKVEEALKEFLKIAPTIRKAVQQVQDSFQKIDTKVMTNKIKQSVQFVKKKIEDLKKSNQNNQIKLTVNNKEAQKQISQIQKQIDSLQEKINVRQMKLDIITPQLDKITGDTTKTVTPKGLNSNNPATQQTINSSLSGNKDYTNLLGQENKLTQEISEYNQQVDTAKSKMSQLEQETSKTATSQNKATSFSSMFKGKLEQAKGSIGNIKNIFDKIPNITKSITNHIKKMGTGIKTGVGHVLKYAGSLFSLRGIYSTLSNSASAWLSSQNSWAQQLSANIEYMKYAMGSMFAPVIEYVINLVYQLMKAIQSVVYAFSGVNIFAKATASSMGKTAKSAKETGKSLAGIHGEINNVSENNNSDSGSGATSPNMDLSQIDSQISPLSQKLMDFFKPLVDSWNTYGQGLIEQVKITASQVGGLISSVWGSFENIITNGTVYLILQNILAIIGNIAQAFSIAWNYNGNGDAIIQNMANALNNLLSAINNVTQSPAFQAWLNECSNKFREITEKIASIDWQPLVNALFSIGGTIGTIALDILSGLVDIFKWLAENPMVAEVLLAIAIAIGAIGIAIGIISTVMGIWSAVTDILSIAMLVLHISLLPLIAVIVGIITVITLIVLAIMNWDAIMNFLKETVGAVITAVIEFFTNLWSQVSFIFEAIWNVISTILGFIWNMISTVFTAIWNIISPIINAIWSIISTIFGAIWNIISTILGSIWNIFSQIFNWIWQLVSIVFTGIWNIISPMISAIWETIKFALEKIKEVWSNIWNGVANIVTNVWNGIWGTIKRIINLILSGIENMVNGVIKGMNWVLGGLSNIANAVGSVIGMNPVDLRINMVSLPRLAKGGVLTEATAVLGGEYPGARSNPEIVTPQNIMEETFDRVLSKQNRNSNAQHVTIQYLGKTIFDDTIDYINEKTRRTGQCVVKVGG